MSKKLSRKYFDPATQKEVNIDLPQGKSFGSKQDRFDEFERTIAKQSPQPGPGAYTSTLFEPSQHRNFNTRFSPLK